MRILKMGLALLASIGVLLRASLGHLVPKRPTQPRVLQFRLHPFVKRGFTRVIAGGRGSGLSMNVQAIAFVCVVLVAIGALLFLEPSSLTGYALAMPSLLVTARELKQERATEINEARKLVDKAEAEKRDFTGEEKTEYDKRFARAEELHKRAERLEQQALAEAGIEGRQADPLRNEPAAKDKDAPAGVRIYRPESQHGARAVVRRSYPLATTEQEEQQQLVSMRRWMMEDVRSELSAAERRALQMDVDTSGGFTVTPQQFVADMIQAVDDQNVIRQYSNVMQLANAESMGRPSLDADPADADWTTEILTGSEDSTMAFGKREMRPHPFAKLVKISKKLLRASALNPEALLRERLAYKFAVTEEKAFLTGDGAQKPLGIFTASDDGIGTGRDVSTDNTGTAVTFDGLKNAKWFLKAAYHNSARWIAHRDFGKQIDKLKDGEGRYIWEASVLVGSPDTLLKMPIHFAENAPSTFTTGQYVAVLGDFKFYWIVEALNFDLQKLVELYAATNQIGFIGRQEIDAAPVLGEAFVRVKLG